MNMEIEVTSASRTVQKLSETAAAVYVITSEDIRRSGCENIPDALRLAPGLEVAHIDSSKWAITSRGFNDLFSNKMLVMIDGRSVYTPVFSGVWWDTQDLVMSDIDRIEIIRGPGATMWGANAVNGVINIITKSARATQGWMMATEGGGVENRNLDEFHYGGIIGNNGHFRVYGKQLTHNSFDLADSSVHPAAWDQNRGGFRADWTLPKDGIFTAQGDVYNGLVHDTYSNNLQDPSSQIVADEVKVSGQNLLARWKRTISPASDSTLQVYFDRTTRNDDMLYGETRNTYDLDYQYHSWLDDKNEMIWGLGYRYTNDDMRNGMEMSFDPLSRVDRLYSAFIQDKIKLDKSRLTIGSKFEHNGYTGFEVQPNVRFVWTLRSRQTFWAAASRAVRTPARVESDGKFNLLAFTDENGIENRVNLFGSRNYRSEELLAYELGYRTQPISNLSLDFTLFYNRYDHLRTFSPGMPYMEDGSIIIPLILSNEMSSDTYEAELAANCTVNDHWRLSAAITTLQAEMLIDPNLGDIMSKDIAEDNTPRGQVNLRSYLDLPGDREFDVMLYRTGAIPGKNVRAYTRMDVRFG